VFRFNATLDIPQYEGVALPIVLHRTVTLSVHVYSECGSGSIETLKVA